jgi:hypothetical protein
MQLFSVIGTIGDQGRPIDSRWWKQDEAWHRAIPISMVELMGKKVLVRTDQAEMTKGKNVVVSHELRNWMIKPHNPEIGMWKENMLQKPTKRVNPMSAMLIEKYQLQLEED